VFFSSVPRLAVGDNITYAWVEDDGQSAGGELVVTSQALSQGLITQASVVAFDFSASTPYASFNFDSPSISSIPISTVDASPIQAGTTIFSYSEAPPGDSQVQFDTNWNVSYGEFWVAVAFAPEGTGGSMSGYGHWVISEAADPPAAAPEPSSLILMGIGMIGGLAIARKAGSKLGSRAIMRGVPWR
jgi:hypothetical protein